MAGCDLGLILTDMSSIEVNGLPEEVYRTFQVRAAAAGMSLPVYLLAHLIEEASTPTLDEVLVRPGRRASGNVSLAEAARLVRADRDTR